MYVSIDKTDTFLFSMVFLEVHASIDPVWVRVEGSVKHQIKTPSLKPCPSTKI